jgi:hypothetical protein
MNQTGSGMPSRVDKILDLLLDALLERQMARRAAAFLPPKPEAIEVPPPPEPPAAKVETVEEIEPVRPQTSLEETEVAEGAGEMEPDELDEEPVAMTPVPTGQMGRALSRLAIGILLLVALLNVPINRHGVSLARVMPDSASLIIRDGLLLKAENADEVYVLQDEKLRWISSLEAFEYFHYRWDNVHIVEASFLDRFEKGWPVHVLLKCDASPHIYALENGQKRWIKDIPTFEAKEYVWEDIKFVSCPYLRSLPDGLPIPEDAGPPPQP